MADENNTDETDKLFEEFNKFESYAKNAINSTINNSYVYGSIIILIMVFVYLTFSIHNLNNIQNQITTIHDNTSRFSGGGTSINNNPMPSWLKALLETIFSRKNTQIIVLGFYLLLTVAFLFLYNRGKKDYNYGDIDLFENTDEVIKSKMITPLTNFFRKISYITGSLFLLIIIIIFILWIYNSFIELQNLFTLILTILNFIILLTFIYAIFQNQISRLLNNTTGDLTFIEKIIRIIGQFIFLIPCLLLLLIDIIKYQIKITTPTVWIILMIEIIIIALYFFIPFVLRIINEHDGKLLLQGPVFIDRQRMIGTYQNVEKLEIYRKKLEEFNFALFENRRNFNTFDKKTNTFTDETPPINLTVDLKIRDPYGQRFNFYYNYAVSFFVYLNPQPINTSPAYVVDTPIFDYASKPKIVFNGLEQKLKFICLDQNNLEKVVYETNDFKYQKWMHIVVNYRSGTVDIFIDGTLRATENNIQLFMEFSKIYAGSDNGIAGGIKNIMYFNKPLTLDKIKYINNFG